MSVNAGQVHHPLLRSLLFFGLLIFFNAYLSFGVKAEDEIRIITVGEQEDDVGFEEPSSFSVIDRQEMDQRGVINFKDLFRYQPGVEVRRSRRYGVEDINIRGLDGNRILYNFNGIRLPERFEFGPFRQTRGQWIDLLSVGKVEIIKGPASVLYGDGALGGVVSFSSLNPEDFLGDDDGAAEAVLMLSSENSSIAESLRYAVEDSNGIMALFSISRSDSEEPHPIADPDLINNQDNDGTAFSSQIMIPLSDDIKFRLKALGSKQTTRTTVGDGELPSGQWGYVVHKDYETITNKLWQLVASLEFDELMVNPFFSGAQLDVYYQGASQVDQRYVRRTESNLDEVERTTNVNAANQVSGFKLSRKHDVYQGDIVHELRYGIDYSRTFNSRRRDRIQKNLEDGTKTRNLSLGKFPVKDYPDSLTNRVGAFFEDTLVVDSLKFIAGIRYESVNMNALPDSTFAKSGSIAEDTDIIVPSWRLAALWNIDQSHVVWINYNRSFRMPLYSEMNSGYTNLTYGYKSIGNPDLEEEIVNGFELGLRGRQDYVRYGITGYYNFYKNFIESGRQVGTTLIDGRNFVVYQAVNAENAVIYGLEGYVDWSSLPDGFGLRLRAGFNYSVGDDLEIDQPLTSIDPSKIVFSIGYREPSDRWSSELVGTAFGRARVPDDSFVFIPSSYVRWDLLASWSISSKFRINIGILNLFDHKHYSYADTKYISDTGYRDMSGFSLPGRSYQAGFSLRL